MPTLLERKAPSRRKYARSLLLLPFGAVALLGGCAHNVDRMRTSSIAMDDYRNRHPIVLAEDAIKLDIFPPTQGRGFDARTYEQVEEYGRLYRSAGSGSILAFVPAGGYGRSDAAAIGWIRRALAAGGASAPLQITTYPVINRDLASPIRLSFIGLKAKVADPCGQWPSDLASGSALQGWNNKPYWNFGCAYQNMIAEQVADPRDLVGPRAEDPADTEMRARAISDIRKGTDPTTDWKTKNTNISTVGTQ